MTVEDHYRKISKIFASIQISSSLISLISCVGIICIICRSFKKFHI